MSLTLTWLGHASFLVFGSKTVYIDPWKIEGEPHDADVILISHSHYDHFSIDDIKALRRDNTEIVASADVVEELGYGMAVKPGDSVTVSGSIAITAVPAYNLEKEFHPREKQWLGFILSMEGKKVYYAGDTDLIEEMGGLDGIDLALLPVGGTFTMDAEEAAKAAKAIAPSMVVPYHWGDIVGTRKDAQRFLKSISCKGTLLKNEESITL
ncbi:MBL fold metallo-hydrolase [Sediminispirochaeta smaragdinae]|jgi:L-ascorbate metabolism protein UlaG (beta-lactamase superfamily)|uniref:Metal dependent hydrolase n=1 Tax=Sediminispirochaeta smaragdinae (strain DSM 11293 / JCM 15392 / SEBR 4228) TaxID=573413 RepID=E1RCU0_SEDSS|nr:MBL fold metallo-hydrolase [Sediminispirochaeta smaragdinae]ADK80170.1 metal dependent hydrolase [Sediminispirochaeta smaragdinae DSM 11293]